MQKVKYFFKPVARQALACLFALLFIAVSAQVAQVQFDQYDRWENGVTEPWSVGDFTKEEISVVQSLWKAIEAENQKQSMHEWAGDYFVGSDTHGTYLRWSPQVGFVIANVDKCQARLMGLTYGKVTASPTLIRFFPAFHKTASMSHGHSQKPALAEVRFVPVKWRNQYHFIAEDELADFGDYVAGLGKYNDWAGLYIEITEFFTGLESGQANANALVLDSNGDGKLSADSPRMPPGYEHYLKKPIRARITAVGNRRLKRDYTFEGLSRSVTHTFASVTYVRVNAGTAHGVKSGLMLRVVDSKAGDEVRIIRAGKLSSTGVVVRDINENSRETFYDSESERQMPYPQVAAGWELTTNPF